MDFSILLLFFSGNDMWYVLWTYTGEQAVIAALCHLYPDTRYLIPERSAHMKPDADCFC